MGFTTKIIITEEKNSFLVKDCSSYGAVGFRIDDIINAFLEVQPPSATDKYPFKIITYPVFPNKRGDEFGVMPSRFKMDELESGEWKIKFTIEFKNRTGGTVTKTTFCSVVFIKTVECCVDKLTPVLKPGKAFTDQKQKTILELSNLLEGAKLAMERGLNGEANKVIDYLKAHCKCCGCS